MISFLNQDAPIYKEKNPNQIPDSFGQRHLSIRENLGVNKFLLSDNNMGVLYSWDGTYDEPKTGRELDDELAIIFKALRELSLGIPIGSGNVNIQMICSQRETETVPEKSYNGAKFEFSASDLGEILSEYERDLFTHIKPVVRKFYLAIVWEPPKQSFLKRITSKSLGFFKPSGLHDEAFDSYLEELSSEFDEKLKGLELQLAHVRPLTRLGSKDYIDYVQNILHFGQGKEVYPADTNIHEQIYNPPLEYREDGLYHEKQSIRPFVLHQIPEPRKFSTGRLRHFLDGIPCKNWDYIWSFTDGNFEARPDFVFRKIWFNFIGGGMSKAGEIEGFENNIAFTRPYGKQSVRVLLYSPSQADEGRLKSAATGEIGARIVPEKEIPIHIIETSLPLNLRKDGHSIKGLTREIRLEEASAFWPIFDGPSRKEGHRWLISRYGTPTMFNRFGGYGLRNTITIGCSGAGKSSETTVALGEFMEMGGIIRGIDARSSYRKLIDLVGGVLVDFSREAIEKDPYSPFALDNPDDTDIACLKNLICTALSLGTKNITIDSVHDTILTQSVLRAYKTHKRSFEKAREKDLYFNPHPIWKHVVAEFESACEVLKHDNLKGVDDAKSELVKWGMILDSNGDLGYIFSEYEKRKPIAQNIPILIYDVGKVDGNENHALIAAQIAAIRIRKDMTYDFEGKTVPMLALFEEFGILVSGTGSAAKFNSDLVINVAKTGRKTNTMIHVNANSIGDIANTKAGQDLLQNAAQIIFLPLEKLYDAAKKAWGEQYNKAEWQIIKSLELERHLKRSSAYIVSKVGKTYKASVYLPLTPLLDALITTDEHQTKLYDRFCKEGKSPLAALKYMAKHHPFGENL